MRRLSQAGVIEADAVLAALLALDEHAFIDAIEARLSGGVRQVRKQDGKSV